MSEQVAKYRFDRGQVSFFLLQAGDGVGGLRPQGEQDRVDVAQHRFPIMDCAKSTRKVPIEKLFHSRFYEGADAGGQRVHDRRIAVISKDLMTRVREDQTLWQTDSAQAEEQYVQDCSNQEK